LLAGRDPAQDVILEGKRVYMGTGGAPTQFLDPGSDTVRPGTLRDLRDLARLAEALEHCDFIVIPLYPTDIPVEVVPVNRFYTCLAHSTKHVMGGLDSVAGARAVLEMATLVSGSLRALQERPIVSGIVCWMVSPLRLDNAATDILLEWCRSGLPVALSAAPMAGLTSPVTLAGTLVQLNAEQLSGIVLTQAARPGTPVLAGYVPGLANLRSGGYVAGAVECGMMQAAAAQMAHFYRVPIYGSGGMSDAKIPDAQAGYEKMATLLLAAMGGCNYIHHAVGMVMNMGAVSLEQAVLDNEAVGMVKRVLQGIEVGPTSLAIEVIGRAGYRGEFASDSHTVQWMRSETFQPRLADRQSWSGWLASGGQDSRARAIAEAQRLLDECRCPGLPLDVDADIRARLPIVLPRAEEIARL